MTKTWRGTLFVTPATHKPDTIANSHIVAPIEYGGSPSSSASPPPGLATTSTRANSLREPTAVQEEDKKAHELTHIPYGAWCEAFVWGRGREDAGIKKHGVQHEHVNALDYALLTNDSVTKRQHHWVMTRWRLWWRWTIKQTTS